LIGMPLEIVGAVLVTLLLPVLLTGAALVDLYLWLRERKPWVGVRLVMTLWSFLVIEVWAMEVLLSVWIASGGPFGKGSMRRRRGIYWLRPRWARLHFGSLQRLFGLRVETEGLDQAHPRALVFIRHASIVDNLVGDTFVAWHNDAGLRYVIKRELQAIGVIDIGGRWIPTVFLRRVSDNPAAEIAKITRLTEDLGPAEYVFIYPEGTRATEAKIKRAKEKVRESSLELGKLADPLVNLLPPRLGGPLALIAADPSLDLVICGHVGFDGYESIGDIWRGRLVGQRIKVRCWRFAAEEIPRDEAGATKWMYERWHELDRWVSTEREGLASERSPAPTESTAS
ncbi:MAG: 1-acyl-sn-glycerol-3-phosphate acyltransferase, partial [Solirubrobacterales bacterium]